MDAPHSLPVRVAGDRFAFVFGILFSPIPWAAYDSEGFGWLCAISALLPLFYFARTILYLLTSDRLRLEANSLMLERKVRGLHDWKARESILLSSEHPVRIHNTPGEKKSFPTISVSTEGRKLMWTSQLDCVERDASGIEAFLASHGLETIGGTGQPTG